MLGKTGVPETRCTQTVRPAQSVFPALLAHDGTGFEKGGIVYRYTTTISHNRQEILMVVGFIILAGLIVYLILSIVMIFFGVRYARKRGIPGWKGGLLTTVIMYLILFWDWIPMRATYSYLCNSQGGVTIYKTFEQWQNENPGFIETLMPEKDNTSIVEGNRRYVRLNQRFIREIYTTRYLFDIRNI
ncbi:MAG: hypothetical protein KZQ78_04275 [Candidatus Thiodiazotropha sp. (ex Ustalcina ferruginea)]|nr:hypothetical protein [Candidatus Thiodiazotropha sp. (ex Ustalcina ferruginea)]